MDVSRWWNTLLWMSIVGRTKKLVYSKRPKWCAQSAHLCVSWPKVSQMTKRTPCGWMLSLPDHDDVQCHLLLTSVLSLFPFRECKLWMKAPPYPWWIVLMWWNVIVEECWWEMHSNLLLCPEEQEQSRRRRLKISQRPRSPILNVMCHVHYTSPMLVAQHNPSVASMCPNTC